MSKEKYHAQCRLRKLKEYGNMMHKTVWIPEKFAKVGKIVKIKIDGIWDNGWEVTDVWERELSSLIQDRSRDHLSQRSRSDI